MRNLHLTPRQWELLGLVAHGLTNTQAAERMGISRAGVENSLNNIYANFRCPDESVYISRIRAALWYWQQRGEVPKLDPYIASELFEEGGNDGISRQPNQKNHIGAAG